MEHLPTIAFSLHLGGYFSTKMAECSSRSKGRTAAVLVFLLSCWVYNNQTGDTFKTTTPIQVHTRLYYWLLGDKRRDKKYGFTSSLQEMIADNSENRTAEEIKHIFQRRCHAGSRKKTTLNFVRGAGGAYIVPYHCINAVSERLHFTLAGKVANSPMLHTRRWRAVLLQAAPWDGTSMAAFPFWENFSKKKLHKSKGAGHRGLFSI